MGFGRRRRNRRRHVHQSGESHHTSPQAVGRRELFRFGVGAGLSIASSFALGGASVKLLTGCSSDGGEPLPYETDPALLKAPLPSPAWLSGARIGGFEAYDDESADKMNRRLDDFARQMVTVLEADGELSTYLDDEKFKLQMDLMHRIAEGAHKRGMRCVAYYPTLEVLTPNAEKTPHTMLKDHLDWVQVSLDGKPNSFVGGGGRVFWVEPGEESTWMCPTSGYLDYFCNRVNAMARTALDGLWGDVPLLSDISSNWPCVNPTCRDKFKRETGRDQPTKVDWEDETFRIWVNWRHKIMWEFEQEVLKRSKAVRSDFETIMETVTMDYNGCTVQGLDGAYRDDGGVYRCWEVDAVSDGSAMRNGSSDDWVSMAAMMRHGACSSRPRASWIFSYGLEDADAEYVMALAIVTGNCPYETKIPLMCTSVGAPYRTRMFGWMAENHWIYEAEPINPAAILFSTSSRDFLDQNKGVGLYTSQYPQDKLWWATEVEANAQSLEYVGDYRGAHKALIHSHVPFDVLTSPHFDATSMARYRLLFVPSPVALSDDHIALLKTYVNDGGTVIVNGMDGGLFRDTGEKRPVAAINAALGVVPEAKGFVRVAVGKGQVLHYAGRLGQEYLRSTANYLLKEVIESAKISRTALETNAPAAVVFDMRRGKDGRIGLLAANLDGLGELGTGQFTPKPASFQLWIPLGGKTPARVTLSTPVTPKPEPIAFTHDAPGDRVSVTIAFAALALVTVE